MNKTDLIQKVKALEGLTQDERAYLVNLVNTKKKYDSDTKSVSVR